jgi:hypothetical protein
MIDDPRSREPFDCRMLDEALASDDPLFLGRARRHALHCERCARDIDAADTLAQIARSMHREWDSPHLWRATATAIRAIDDAQPTRWRMHFGERVRAGELADAFGVMSFRPAAFVGAALVVAIAALSWFAWQRMTTVPPAIVNAGDQRLLSEHALAEIERSEADYVRAIDALARAAQPKADTADSPLLIALRERLLAIDSAITDCRAEIARNRFNAHVRRQLLSMYREKRRTLEAILETDDHAL